MLRANRTLPGGLFRIFQRSAIGAFQNYFARAGFHSGAIEQDRQWNAGPLRVADRAQSPLHAFDFRLEKIAIVAGAFEVAGIFLDSSLTTRRNSARKVFSTSPSTAAATSSLSIFGIGK